MAGKELRADVAPREQLPELMAAACDNTYLV